jgi:hypothetical protein
VNPQFLDQNWQKLTSAWTATFVFEGGSQWIHDELAVGDGLE